ncbi:MAG TPA: PfkB family carbohydrate kinase [Actinophytocola sp.]|uniref:PfkB family carbohydrate kinase n=1 Tax=Actinophytocola sp. TaxID=1872138 RepID=UPI002DDCBA19|nr:PfkB family carbohydrate kinase [Actinophytocola sp.]HEV2782761.1 PfkB family carbohydrate kinase [Actinophytocola sp.]
MVDAVVVGQIARDLVLVVDEVPAAGGTTPVRTRRELLGGKGANLAVALAQLGTPVAVLGVVGDDEVGTRLLEQAGADRVDVSHVVRRATTGLIVDIVDGAGHWRYLEDLPESGLLTEADVATAQDVLRAAVVTVVQLQQPSAAALAAARYAREGRDGLVVLDGAPPPDERRTSILDLADVLRTDATEASLVAGRELRTAEEAVEAAGELLHRHRMSLVAFAVGDGNVFVWDGGQLVLPLVDTDVVDTTGSGDAFTAALASTLRRGHEPQTAARFAVAAAAATVGHPGGRPELSPDVLREYLNRVGT